MALPEPLQAGLARFATAKFSHGVQNLVGSSSNPFAFFHSLPSLFDQRGDTDGTYARRQTRGAVESDGGTASQRNR